MKDIHTIISKWAFLTDHTIKADKVELAKALEGQQTSYSKTDRFKRISVPILFRALREIENFKGSIEPQNTWKITSVAFKESEIDAHPAAYGIDREAEYTLTKSEELRPELERIFAEGYGPINCIGVNYERICVNVGEKKEVVDLI